MPGPVSDSIDDIWGTSSNRDEVVYAIECVRLQIGKKIGSPPKPILGVVMAEDRGPKIKVTLTEAEWRVIRFAMSVALGEEEL